MSPTSFRAACCSTRVLCVCVRSFFGDGGGAMAIFISFVRISCIRFWRCRRRGRHCACKGVQVCVCACEDGLFHSGRRQSHTVRYSSLYPISISISQNDLRFFYFYFCRFHPVSCRVRVGRMVLAFINVHHCQSSPLTASHATYCQRHAVVY